MHSRLLSLSRGVYLAGLALALVFVIPAVWFPLQVGKLAIFSICLLVSAVLFVLGGGVRPLWRTPGIGGVLLLGLIPLSYVLSWCFSVEKAISLTGYGIEADTVAFTVLAFLTFAMGFAHFRTLRTVRLFLTTLFWTLVAAVVFQFLSILSGAIPFAVFTDRSVNLIGKWNDLGLLAGVLLVLSLVRLQFNSLTVLARGALWVLGVALVVLLGFINFSLVWGLVAASCAVLATIAFLTERRSGGETGFSWSRMPWLSVSVGVLSLVLVIYGQMFNLGLTKMFPVSSLEVRPSYGSTMQVVSASREGSAARLLVGTGPNTFGREWLMHKPTGVNESAFWNLDFSVGFSTLATALGTVGIVGALMLLLPILLVLAGAIRLWRLKVLTREDRGAAISIALAALLLSLGLVFYVPSSNVLLVMFAAVGAAWGFLWRQGRSAPEDSAHRWGAFAIGSSLVLLLLVGALTFVTARRALAQTYIAKASVALGQNDPDKALNLLMKADGIERTADGLRLATDAGGAKLALLAQSDSQDQAQLQQQFSDLLQQTVSAGNTARMENPGDYRATLSLARIYDFLTVLKIEGAYDVASSSYLAAMAENPTNPELPLLLARLEASQGHGPAVEEYIKKSLTLKPNYTDAMLLVAQVAVANNDLQTAIAAAQSAAQTAPGVPSIWFELGLLYYAGNDTKDAIAPLEQAVALVPDYANAKYFLGLSYYAQGRTTEATEQFEEIEKSNPDNAEVKLVLANMRAGKPAFDGAQPPANTNPAERETAPLP